MEVVVRIRKTRRKVKALERRRRRTCLRMNLFTDAPMGVFKGIVEKHHRLVNSMVRLGWFKRTTNNWFVSPVLKAFYKKLHDKHRTPVLTANERKPCEF